MTSRGSAARRKCEQARSRRDTQDRDIPSRDAGFLELLRGVPQSVAPPASSPDALPVDQIGWEGFERLIAEVVWLVDGLHTVRIYGRRGQRQDGIDLVGEHPAGRSVYQVRHKQRLTSGMLRKAVVDFAGPPQSAGTAPEGTDRPFDTRRFVYATSAPVGNDSPVERELARLNDEYAGDSAQYRPKMP